MRDGTLIYQLTFGTFAAALLGTMILVGAAATHHSLVWWDAYLLAVAVVFGSMALLPPKKS